MTTPETCNLMNDDQDAVVLNTEGVFVCKLNPTGSSPFGLRLAVPSSPASKAHVLVARLLSVDPRALPLQVTASLLRDISESTLHFAYERAAARQHRLLQGVEEELEERVQEEAAAAKVAAPAAEEEAARAKEEVEEAEAVKKTAEAEAEATRTAAAVTTPEQEQRQQQGQAQQPLVAPTPCPTAPITPTTTATASAAERKRNYKAPTALPSSALVVVASSAASVAAPTTIAPPSATALVVQGRRGRKTVAAPPVSAPAPAPTTASRGERKRAGESLESGRPSKKPRRAEAKERKGGEEKVSNHSSSTTACSNSSSSSSDNGTPVLTLVPRSRWPKEEKGLRILAVVRIGGVPNKKPFRLVFYKNGSDCVIAAVDLIWFGAVSEEEYGRLRHNPTNRTKDLEKGTEKVQHAVQRPRADAGWVFQASDVLHLTSAGARALIRRFRESKAPNAATRQMNVRQAELTAAGLSAVRAVAGLPAAAAAFLDAVLA